MMKRIVCSGLLLLVPATATAQGVRGTATTMARYVEIRPVEHDTIAFDQVEALPDGTFRFDGLPISCIPQLHCIRYVAADRQGAVLLTQDVGVTAWGLGVEGLSATVQLRARADLGDFTWPRSDDAFDAILAYAELLRGDFRFRAGRLQNTSGLGFSSYDGAHVLYTPIDRVRVQAFAGRSLARGVYEPRHEVLAGVEDFLPDRNALLFGGEVEADPWNHTNVAARYQREIWTNRSALVSERASIDVRSSVLAPVQLVAGIDYDFAFGRIGKANLNARMPVADGRVIVEAVGARYVPYFELWTIWGYFSPVAYHEGELRASWRARPGLNVRGGVGYRKYDDAHAPVIFDPLPDDAISLTAQIAWAPSPGLALDASWRMERGFGAYLGSADVAARVRAHDRVDLMFDVSAFQQIEEFRLGDGVVLGGGAAVDIDVTSFATLSGGAHIYRQTWDNRPGDADWNQVRGWAGLRVRFGSDPGLAGRSRP